MGIEQIRALKLAAALKPNKQLKGIVKTKDFEKSLPPGVMTGGEFGKVKGGNYETSKGSTWFRSKMEANYALYLDFLIRQGKIKEWVYEDDTFVFDKIKYGTKRYIPDFRVTNMDGSIEYHETKGFMTGKDKTKMRRMAKYYPEIKLVLIDDAFYKDLVKKMKTVLKFY